MISTSTEATHCPQVRAGGLSDDLFVLQTVESVQHSAQKQHASMATCERIVLAAFQGSEGFVIAVRALIGGSVVAIAASALVVAPALGASELDRTTAKRPSAARSVGGFTPAAADPRLAAAFARSGLADGQFRFTPSENRQGNRPVTVAVRARSTQVADARRTTTAAAPTVGLVPVAYNLGVSVGWKRFAVSGDVAKIDLAGQPGSREAADVSVSYSMPRFTGRVKAAADRPLPGAAPQMVEEAPSYSLDVGGSYSLTRNIDLTAGLRYKSERERLARFNDDRRDSQAVYLGTAFRF